MSESLYIEVVLALREHQELVALWVLPGTTTRQAVELSGLLAKLPREEIRHMTLGIFGKVVKDDAALREYDRVEIYRPLKADPKTIRRQRAVFDKKMRESGTHLLPSRDYQKR